MLRAAGCLDFDGDGNGSRRHAGAQVAGLKTQASFNQVIANGRNESRADGEVAGVDVQRVAGVYGESELCSARVNGPLQLYGGVVGQAQDGWNQLGSMGCVGVDMEPLPDAKVQFDCRRLVGGNCDLLGIEIGDGRGFFVVPSPRIDGLCVSARLDAGCTG